MARKVHGDKNRIKIAGVLVLPKVELVLHSVALKDTAANKDGVIVQLELLMLLHVTTHVSQRQIYGGKS